MHKNTTKSMENLTQIKNEFVLPTSSLHSYVGLQTVMICSMVQRCVTLLFVIFSALDQTAVNSARASSTFGIAFTPRTLSATLSIARPNTPPSISARTASRSDSCGVSSRPWPQSAWPSVASESIRHACTFRRIVLMNVLNRVHASLTTRTQMNLADSPLTSGSSIDSSDGSSSLDVAANILRYTLRMTLRVISRSLFHCRPSGNLKLPFTIISTMTIVNL